ncbi:hypothetical protein [Sphaerisporangium fuscum]|uniref:hypothetical protein n=1 Tax=Sphaerisporangium fuscum TaxID=2835868 RepID=UPI001BDC6871|nr:hypothetical protein [Sphaerisporangium fuscum]
MRRLLLAVAAFAAACAAPPAPHDTTGPPVSRTSVGLTEWSVRLRDHVLAPGKVVLDVTNAGATAHDLVVTGPGVAVRTPVLPPGAGSTLRFTAAPGTRLELVCSVAGHELMGMRASVRVAGPRPAPAPVRHRAGTAAAGPAGRSAGPAGPPGRP